VIVSANGVDVRRLTDEAPATGNRATPLTLQARQSIGKPFTINVERDGKPLELKGDMPATANANAPLGINLSIDVTKMLPANYGVIGSARNTVEDLTGAMVAMVRVPIEIIRGALPISQARPVGIVGITQIGVSLVKQAPQNGPFQFVWFAGILSMLIGLTNLLPFPALDGGRLTFIIIEWIRGKRVDPKREQWVHALGMTFLLGVFVLITALDIFSPVVR
jgi:regulator of sigma E protease